jgi:hypothetical protein
VARIAARSWLVIAVHDTGIGTSAICSCRSRRSTTLVSARAAPASA